MLCSHRIEKPVHDLGKVGKGRWYLDGGEWKQEEEPAEEEARGKGKGVAGVEAGRSGAWEEK